MAREKIDYGIDLGTTNSSICRMEDGEPVIKKSDTLKDTMPSCVYVNKKQAIQVGDRAFNALKKDKLNRQKKSNSKESNSFIEFKRTMGTDKSYYCSNLEREFSSEHLSAEVIKTLKSFITDENFSAVVITVPAMFTINQKDATLRAAIENAGFKHCELLQEPIAASMAYGLKADDKDGYWLVFDFGGGTFDAALLKVEEGIMKVIDTAGDNYLGGKNIDYAIVDEIIIPYLKDNYSIDSILNDDSQKNILQDAMKHYAETMKIEMSFKDEANILSDLGDIPGEDDDGEEFELDITVTQEILKRTLEPIYQKSIDTCKELLKRNNLSGNTLDSLILVGGPTYSPILRSMLGQQILPPDVSADPMTVVAKGAALFASTIDVAEEIIEQQRDKTKLQLELGYEATTVEQEEFITVKTLKDKMINDTFGKVLVDIVRNDNAWSSGKTEIDGNGEVIEVVLNAAKPNAFNILAYDDRGDLLECEPSNFTIIQGSKIGSATLPYNIGVEIKSSSTGKLVFQSLKGLEKNQTTPAIGTKNGLKTQKQIRPGNSEDFIKIAIYQGQYNSEGSQAIYNEHVYDVLISGEDLPKLLPEGSDVDLTLKVDKSERITGSAYFPSLDYSVDILLPSNTRQAEIDTDWLESELEKAHQSINIIKHEGDHVNADEINKLDSEVSAIKNHFDQARTDYDRKKDVLDSLRSALRRIDEVQSANEWPKIEEEIKDIFYRLEETNSQYGNEKTNTLLEQFREQIPKIIQEQNVKIAQGVIDSMRELDFALIDEGLGAQMEIMYLSHFNEDFDTMDWLDRDRARMTLDRGIQMAANNPIKEELRSVIVELYKLLPDADQKIVGGGDGSELIG